MLNPEYLRRITEGSEQIAEELHQYIISEIPFTVNYVGERVKGKFDITSGTFTADSE